MGLRGRTRIALLSLFALLALLAFSPAYASASTTLKVTETTDAKLASGAKTCESEAPGKGCTLRAAVELADELGEATIDVPEGSYKEELEPAVLPIDKGAKVTIVGEGATKTTIERSSAAYDHVFEVFEEASLTLRGATVKKGGEYFGGGFLVYGASLTLEESTVSEDEAEDGGGVYAAAGASVTIRHSQVEDDFAYEAGGGVYGEASDAVTIEDSSLSEDFAEFAGGGVYAGIDSSFVIKKSSIESGGAELGGGVYTGEVYYDDSCEARTAKAQARERAAVVGVHAGEGVTIEHSTVEGNEAYRGGGIFVGFEEESCPGLKSPQAKHQSAHTAAAAVRPSTQLGPEEEPMLTVKQSTIAHNKAAYGAGVLAEYEVSIAVEASTRIEHNEAKYSGGGIYGYDALITIAQSTVSENTAAGFDGGGIYAEGEEGVCIGARSAHTSARDDLADEGEVEGGLSITQSTISKNVAGEGFGGDGDGGGIYAATYYFEDCGVRSAHTSAHKVETADSPSVVPPEADALRIERSTIAGNKTGSDGGGKGGGIYENTEFEDPIINSTITGNGAGERGGGLWVARGIAALISDTVADNTSEQGDGPASNLGANAVEETAIELRNTIVAEPTGSTLENCEGQIESLITGAGYNLDYPSTTPAPGSDDTCGMSSAESDLVNKNPELEGLLPNGGLTETMALPSGSPAIGFVPVKEDCESSETGPGLIDQRGDKRPGIPGDGCDIGAYEYQKPAEKPIEKHEEPPAEKHEEKHEEAKKEVLPVKITSPVQCTSKRDIIIHIQNVKQLGIVSAVVSIDGKHKRTLTGKHLTAAIDLRGLPKGTFTVEIVARTAGGRTLHGKRVYHTCRGTPLPGHSRLLL